MTFYAPGADIAIKGNPDFIGTMVCKSFYANGNVSWHMIARSIPWGSSRLQNRQLRRRYPVIRAIELPARSPPLLIAEAGKHRRARLDLKIPARAAGAFGSFGTVPRLGSTRLFA